MTEQKLLTFSRFAWFALFYNILVILWGVFLRASYSGDGCGQHWLTCQGEAIPSAPELKTIIEFSHRLTTALAGVVVVVLAGWAFVKFPRGDRVRVFALLSLVFIVVEGAIGGGLVLTGNTAANWTPTRPYWTAGHLINTFVLLAFLSLTAWCASRPNREWRALPTKYYLIFLGGAAVLLLTGISGSMASLAHMLFPSASLIEGIGKDFDPNSHPLLRLRVVHPIFSVFAAVLLIIATGWIRQEIQEDAEVSRWSKAVLILVVVQIAFGAVTLLTLAPIVMQIGHLLLADLIWISFVLLGASCVSKEKY